MRIFAHSYFMYEPKYLPDLKQNATALNGLRFCAEPFFGFKDCKNADPLHAHEYYEVFFNLSSDVSFLVNDKLYPVLPCEAMVSRPGDVHMAVFKKSEVQNYVCVWIRSPDKKALPKSFISENFNPHFVFNSQEKTKARLLTLALANACDENHSEIEKLSCLLNFLRFLDEVSIKNTLAPKTDTSVLNEKSEANQSELPELMEKILDDMRKNFTLQRSVNDVANEYFISYATLCRWFRKYLRWSPRAYLESIRLSNARAMLLSGSSVTEACFASGFSDCSHFISLFKRKFGKTPFLYKKEVGINTKNE